MRCTVHISVIRFAMFRSSKRWCRNQYFRFFFAFQIKPLAQCAFGSASDRVFLSQRALNTIKRSAGLPDPPRPCSRLSILASISFPIKTPAISFFDTRQEITESDLRPLYVWRREGHFITRNIPVISNSTSSERDMFIECFCWTF